jgi:FkbM family methyltransferase
MDLGSARTETVRKEFPTPSEKPQSRVLFSLKAESPEDSRLVNFHQLEHYSGISFRWSEPVSMIRIKMAPANASISIDTACLRGDSLDFPFQIHWNEYKIPRKSIRVQQGTLTFEISSRVCEPTGEQRLTISSKPLNAENGRRKLGMPFFSLKVIESDTASSDTTYSFEKYAKLPRKSWFSSASRIFSNPTTPTLPIWQVRIPDLTYANPNQVINKQTKESYPACDQAIVVACEINARHGTGLLIQYLIDDFENLATVNSYHCYNGDRVASKVHHCLPQYHKITRQEVYDQIVDWFGQSPPKQALVVPYFASDFYMAMALKDLFKTKICMHVMDDNSIFGAIPNSVVQEAVDKCDLLYVISPEMRQHYEQRFGKKAYMLPPIVPEEYIASRLVMTPPESITPSSISKPSVWKRLTGLLKRKKSTSQPSNGQSRGILIGNIWDTVWLDLLRRTIRESGLQIDWYANNPKAFWHQVTREELQADGIFMHDSLWGQDLVNELRRRPFAIHATGLLSGEGTKESIARLSLPSRMPFMIATAHLPIIVIGNSETAAAKFLRRFDLGTTVDYDGAKLKEAIEDILRPERQQSIRHNAYKIAGQFSNRGLKAWLWNSLERRQPADDRFESLFEPKQGEFCHYFDAEPPEEIHWSFRETWKLINRVKSQGFYPETVIDIGASTGVWSYTASTIFPKANFVLVDPLMNRYSEAERRYYLSKIDSQQFEEVALSDHCGQMQLLVSDDLYGSSLLKINESLRSQEMTSVEVLTLDELTRRRGIRGRTLLKIDVQFAEHLVINGGRSFIDDHVDVVILELTIHRAHSQAKTYREMLELMDHIGFEVIDEMEGWRDPKTGILEQKDTVFVRKERNRMLRAA